MHNEIIHLQKKNRIAYLFGSKMHRQVSIHKETGFPIFSVFTAKSRKPRLALARLPYSATEFAINLQILF